MHKLCIDAPQLTARLFLIIVYIYVFGDFLKLLVTTSCSLLLVDMEVGDISSIDRGSGLYYGISFSDTEIMVGARNRMVSSDINSSDECGEILIFDYKLTLRNKLRPKCFNLRDIHEIAWFKEKLWVTCSYDNMVVVWDGHHWEKWFPLGTPANEPYDINHFNSLFFEDNAVWILAHNRGLSEILKYDATSLELEAREVLGVQAHNIWRDGDEYRTCSSGEGAIVGTKGFRLFCGGFPRGIVVTNTGYYVGISEIAEKQDRDITTPRILKLDKNFNVVGKVVLQNEGLLLDMKVYDESRFRRA